MKHFLQRSRLRPLCGVLLLVGALASNLLAGFFAQELIAEAAILALFALSLDFLASCGLVSFGHAGLLGVGAYLFGGLTILLSISPGWAMAGSVLGGAVVAFAVGAFVVRTSGAYFIMVTLAVAEMFFAWAFRAKAFNGGDGMGGIPRLDLTGIGVDLNDPSAFSLACLLVCSVLWLLLELLTSSPFGRTLSAIRQNSGRVTALGGRVYGMRLAAFTISGAVAALAGTLKVQHTNFLSPELASWFVSGDVLIAVVIGGMGTLVGGPLGAGILVILKDQLSGLVGHWYLFLGAIFALVAIAVPNGLIGALLDHADRWARRNSDARKEEH